MIVAYGEREGRTFLLLGLSDGNLKALKEDRPILLTPETHPGCPAGIEIIICHGATERAIAERLKPFMAEDANIVVVPNTAEKVQ